MKQTLTNSWKHISSMVLGLGVGLPLGGVLLAHAAPPKAQTPEVLRAQRFELVDKDGKVEAELGFASTGKARLLMRGNDSRAAAGPSIEVEDNEGRRVLIGGGGNSWLTVQGRDGLFAFAVGEESWGDGKPVLTLTDSSKNRVIIKADSSEIISLPSAK